MSLLSESKSLVAQNVLKHGHSSESWRVLVINEHTAQILCSLFSNSELLAYEILTIQHLEDADRESYVENPAIYFINFDKNLYETVKKDHAAKKFSKFTIISINDISESLTKKLDKLAEPPLVYNTIHHNYTVVDENAFLCKSDDIKHVIEALNIRFTFYSLGNCQENLMKQLDQNASSIKTTVSGDCILYDRLSDLTTPLVRFFTFEVYLHDLGFVRNEIVVEHNIDIGSSKLWRKIRDLHIADVNAVLSEEACKLNAQINAIKTADTKGLVDLVLKAPDQMALKKEVTMFLDLLDRTYGHFEKHKMNEYGCLQQNICLRKKEDGSSYTSSANDCWQAYSNSNYSLDDKYKLWLLSLLFGCNYSSSENKQLIKNGIINKKDLTIVENIDKLRKSQVGTKKPPYKYSMSRYQPLFYHVVKDFVSCKKGLKFIKHSNHDSLPISSLRKSEFVFKPDSKHKYRKNILIYVNGGITKYELGLVRILSKEMGVEIFLGSDKILELDDYCCALREKKI